MIDYILQPWPWYVAGPLIGLMVPAFIVFGQKRFGISASFRHLCTLAPVKPSFFNYRLSEHAWNLVFVLGLVVGGFIASNFLSASSDLVIAEQTKTQLMSLGFTDFSGLAPKQLFADFGSLNVMQLVVLVLSGFIVGLGATYAGGCTSGHTITGISLLRLGSITATIGFFIGGLFATHVLFNLVF